MKLSIVCTSLTAVSSLTRPFMAATQKVACDKRYGTTCCIKLHFCICQVCAVMIKSRLSLQNVQFTYQSYYVACGAICHATCSVSGVHRAYNIQIKLCDRLVPTEWVAPHPLTLGWKQCTHCFQLCMEPLSVPYRMEVCRHRGGHLHNLITRGAQFVVLLLSLDSQPQDHNV